MYNGLLIRKLEAKEAFTNEFLRNNVKLEVRNVRKTFGDTVVLDKVSLELYENEFVSLSV